MQAIRLYIRCLVANKIANFAAASTAFLLVLLWPALLSGSHTYPVLVAGLAGAAFIVFIATGAAFDTYIEYQLTAGIIARENPRRYAVPANVRHQVRAGIELACKDNGVWIDQVYIQRV